MLVVNDVFLIPPVPNPLPEGEGGNTSNPQLPFILGPLSCSIPHPNPVPIMQFSVFGGDKQSRHHLTADIFGT
jgi:hypothetical protein